MIPFTGIFKKKDKDRYMLIVGIFYHCALRGEEGGQLAALSSLLSNVSQQQIGFKFQLCCAWWQII